MVFPNNDTVNWEEDVMISRIRSWSCETHICNLRIPNSRKIPCTKNRKLRGFTVVICLSREFTEHVIFFLFCLRQTSIVWSINGFFVQIIFKIVAFLSLQSVSGMSHWLLPRLLRRKKSSIQPDLLSFFFIFRG